MTKPMNLSTAAAQPVHKVAPKKYVFLIQEEFSHLSFTCAVEALRMANGYRGKHYYDWHIVSESGEPVRASNGIAVSVDGDLRELDRRENLLVVGGDNVEIHSTTRILNWLRREARRGVTVGGIGSGAYTMARAGLLIDRPVTTHWEYHKTFTEVFPAVNLQETLYSIDTDRMTCAGGASSMDFMLALIERDFDRELANVVSEKMVYTNPRSHFHTQRLSLQIRAGARHTKFADAIEIMAQNIEEPLSPVEVADRVGLSGRQLERLFKKHLNTTPKTYYTGLRLQKARELLFHTNMSLAEICFACGFNSQTHFSKSYRAKFGVSPSRDNGRL
ncbi:GlxA family transcriptional regulator [Pelagimonas sp. KU-00592-HH]|uniref:GlxA family transcriptional regulator n=1 Tax=Pelagimonas sp. KU-00592-HH TaxID=3127651 RepID=UPI00310943DD